MLRELAQEFRRFTTHTVIAGAIVLLTGLSPEDWLVELADWTGIPKGVLHLGPAGIDLRTVLALAGFSIVLVGIIRNVQVKGLAECGGIVLCRDVGKIDTYYPFEFSGTPNLVIDDMPIRNYANQLVKLPCIWNVVEQRRDGFVVEVKGFIESRPEYRPGNVLMPHLGWKARGIFKETKKAAVVGEDTTQ